MSDDSAPATGTDSNEEQRISLWEAVGGTDYFVAMVDDFYDRVAEEPVLRPMYPEDLTAPRRHTALFLSQYWGGPTTYNEERGHPRLRMRHLPFAIGQVERDAWLEHMLAALRAAPIPEAIGSDAAEMVIAMQTNYFEQASTAMINQSI